jgi:hypothetical protein
MEVLTKVNSADHGARAVAPDRLEFAQFPIPWGHSAIFFRPNRRRTHNNRPDKEPLAILKWVWRFPQVWIRRSMAGGWVQYIPKILRPSIRWNKKDQAASRQLGVENASDLRWFGTAAICEARAFKCTISRWIFPKN